MLSKFIHVAANDKNCFYAWVVFHVGEGIGTPLQYSCLETPMDGGAW